MLYAVVLLIAVGAGQIWMLWHLARAMGEVGRLEERVTNAAGGLQLLTETMEAGFGAMAAELARLSEQRPPASKRPTGRRIAAAARRGRPVSEIAASEDVSEGEVCLRMHLADAERARARGKQRNHAKMRS